MSASGSNFLVYILRSNTFSAVFNCILFKISYLVWLILTMSYLSRTFYLKYFLVFHHLHVLWSYFISFVVIHTIPFHSLYISYYLWDLPIVYSVSIVFFPPNNSCVFRFFIGFRLKYNGCLCFVFFSQYILPDYFSTFRVEFMHLSACLFSYLSR